MSQANMFYKIDQNHVGIHIPDEITLITNK